MCRRVAAAVICMVIAAACVPARPAMQSTPSSVPPATQTAAATATSAEAQAGTPAVALVHGTLIDGTGAEPMQDAVLVIRGERIEAAGRASEVVIPGGAQVIDVKGATMLPGFINAHVHAAYNLTNLAAWAQGGVTTVRDLGAHSNPWPRAIQEQAAGDPRYARLVSGGVMITAPKGYPIAVFHGVGAEVASEEEAVKATSAMLDSGANVVKISLESGVIFGQTIPTLTDEEVRAIVKAAHERGTIVSAHVSVSKDLRRALDDNVDDIAHMVTDRLPDELITKMVQGGNSWEPTLELWKNVKQGMDTNVIDNLRRYVLAGGKVALGTDYAGYYTPFQMGMPMHEMEWMQDAGMTPMQIIVAGTQNAAKVCNLGTEVGTLQPGKMADVLVVQGDPLQDIHALEEARWVIHNGAVIRSPEE